MIVDLERLTTVRWRNGYALGSFPRCRDITAFKAEDRRESRGRRFLHRNHRLFRMTLIGGTNI